MPIRTLVFFGKALTANTHPDLGLFSVVQEDPVSDLQYSTPAPAAYIVIEGRASCDARRIGRCQRTSAIAYRCACAAGATLVGGARRDRRVRARITWHVEASGCRLQHLNLVRCLPAEFRLTAAKVPICSGLGVDRAQQIQHIDNAFGT